MEFKPQESITDASGHDRRCKPYSLQKVFPSDDVVLVCGAIDPILNEHKYIVPGLGDAGDLMYGDKI